MKIDRVPSPLSGTRPFYAAVLPTARIAIHVVFVVAFVSRFQSIYYETIGGTHDQGVYIRAV